MIELIMAGVGLLCLVAVGRCAAKSERPLLGALGSALLGAGSLAAVNLLSGYTGVSIGLNLITSFVAVVLSLPGVVSLLLLRLLLHI